MAINFPDNPTAGDIYTANGRSWQWDGTVWGTYGTQPDPTVLAVDGSNNRVGINTINPTATLDVDGSVVFSGNANIGGSVTIDGDFTVSGTTTTVNTTELNVEDNIVTLNYGVTGTPSLDAGIEVERGDETNAQLLWDESAGAWVVNSDFTVDTSTFHVDSVNDRIGIGTTTPEVNLHIRNSGGAILGAAGTGAGDYAALRLVVGEMNPPRYAAEIIFDDSSYSTTIGTYNNSSTRRDDITIDGATGNVGIGTTTPATALHVEGTVGSNGIVHVVDGATESSIAYKINGSTGNTGWVAGNYNDDYFMYSYTLGGQALALKPSGDVLKPYQPCFRAYHSADIAYSSLSNPIPFNVTEFNIGNNYSTSTYLFTAPQDGVYLANAYLHWRGDSAFVFQFLRFRVNAAYVGIEHMRSGLKDYDVFGGQSIIKLSKDDSLSVYYGANGIDAGYSRGNTNFNSFEVYFLG